MPSPWIRLCQLHFMFFVSCQLKCRPLVNKPHTRTLLGGGVYASYMYANIRTVTFQLFILIDLKPFLQYFDN